MKNTLYKLCLLTVVLALFCSCDIKEYNVTTLNPIATIVVKTSEGVVKDNNESLTNGPFLENLKKANRDYQTFKTGAPDYSLNDFDVYVSQGYKVNTRLGNAEGYNLMAELKDKNFFR